MGQESLHFSCHGLTFPQEEYMQLISPWLKKDLEENKGVELPREGIGCWHPLFPARLDIYSFLLQLLLKRLEL